MAGKKQKLELCECSAAAAMCVCGTGDRLVLATELFRGFQSLSPPATNTTTALEWWEPRPTGLKMQPSGKEALGSSLEQLQEAVT